MNETLTHLDCFSGLGAWTLAAHWLGGIQTVAFVENDKRCQEFLGKAWPGIPIEPDVRTLDGRHYRGTDILTAGVPCQPASRAGKQGGAKDDRWLWDDALRLVAQVGPRCCIFENPPGIEDVGLDGILAALEGQGYEIAPVFDIPACALNSPQLRHRYYIVAFARCEFGSGRRIAGDVAETAGGTEAEAQQRQRLRDAAVNGGETFSMAIPRERPSGRREVQPRERAQERTAAGRSGSRDGGVGQADARSQGHQERVMHRGISEGARLTGSRQALRMGGQNDLANAAGARPDGSARQEQHIQRCALLSARPRYAGSGQWSDFVWLPCADGKVRRAPGDSFSLVDGLHRSILGALGNSQVPQVAYKILEAVTQALTHP